MAKYYENGKLTPISNLIQGQVYKLYDGNEAYTLDSSVKRELVINKVKYNLCQREANIGEHILLVHSDYSRIYVGSIKKVVNKVYSIVLITSNAYPAHENHEWSFYNTEYLVIEGYKGRIKNVHTS